VTTKIVPSLLIPKVFAVPIWNFCSGLSVPIPTRPDVCMILFWNVETPETTRLCAVKFVVVVIPKVLMPVTLTSPTT